MTENLNELYLEDPKKFLKTHLIVRSSKEQNLQYLVRDILFRVEFKRLENVRGEYVHGKTKNRIRGLKDITPVQAVLRRLSSDRNNAIIGQYIPYSPNTAYFRTIRTGTHCVFTHSFTGCHYLVSQRDSDQKKFMHIPSDLRTSLRQRKIYECFGDEPFQEVTSYMYAPSEVPELTQIIGISAGYNQWDLIAQNFVETELFTLPICKRTADLGAKYYATNMYRKLLL